MKKPLEETFRFFEFLGTQFRSLISVEYIDRDNLDRDV